MRIFLLFWVACFVCAPLFAQDTIVRWDDKRIIGKVTEIDDQFIYYQKPPGRRRLQVWKSGVRAIHYANGYREDIELQTYVRRSTGVVRYKQRGSDRFHPGKDRALQSGIFFGFDLGSTFIERRKYYGSDDLNVAVYGPTGWKKSKDFYTSFGFDLGYRNYWKRSDTYSTGLNLTLVRFVWSRIYYMDYITVSPLNLGSTHAFRFGIPEKRLAFEVSADAGLIFFAPLGYHQKPMPGVNAGTHLRFRKHRFSLGLLLNYGYGSRIVQSNRYREENVNMLLSIGLKF